MKVYGWLLLSLVFLSSNFASGEDLSLLPPTIRATTFDPTGSPDIPLDLKSSGLVNPDASKGGELKLPFNGSVNTLVPFDWGGMGRHKIASGIWGQVFEPLMTLKPNSLTTKEGIIAESLEYPKDMSSVTFHLRPEAKFNNASHSPVTASDVEFSYQTLLASDPHWYRDGFYKSVAKVTVVDDHTIRFDLKPTNDLDARNTIAYLAGGIWVINKDYYTQNPIDGAGSKAKPVGTGPYRVASFTEDQQVEYERDPKYWGANLPGQQGQQNFDKIRFLRFQSDSVARLGLTSGDIDCWNENNDAYWFSKFRNLPKNSPLKSAEVPYGNPPSYAGFAINSSKPQLSDVRTRRALASLLDFNYINNVLFDGAIQRSTSYFQGTPYAHTAQLSDKERALLEPFKDSLPPEVFSKEPSPSSGAVDHDTIRTAFQQLKDSGWKFDKESRRFVDDSGKPIVLNIFYTTPNEQRIFLNYQANLRRVGIESRLMLVDPSLRQQEVHSPRNSYDMVFHSVYGEPTPNAPRMKDHFWSGAVDADDMDNEAKVKSPAVDALIEKLKNAATEEDRIAAARALDRVLLAGSYLVPFGMRGVQKLVCRSDIGLPKPSPFFGHDVIQNGWKEAPPTK